jgi:FKBP-type peptidyl-prolyl cis-trans isomerase
MRKGVKVQDLRVGERAEAERGKVVVVRYDLYLNRGEKIHENFTCSFAVGARKVIAGLEYGVEGMRVGGRRRIRVGPHLAYQDKGVPGRVPANGVLIFEVELVEVKD